jgi:hypothetical protein
LFYQDGLRRLEWDRLHAALGPPEDSKRAAAARTGGRDGRILAARVEPKNAPQESKKTDNFKPLVFRQFQAGALLSGN